MSIFGYNRYNEITSEFAIGGTYCDLAIVDARKKIKLLIEVKAVSVALKESHVKQAIDYGANAGVNWVILTNAERWMVFCIKFEIFNFKLYLFLLMQIMFRIFQHCSIYNYILQSLIQF